MIDSFALARIYNAFPPPDKLLSFGWREEYAPRSLAQRKWIYNPPDDSREPNMTFFLGKDDYRYLRVQGSLPKLLFGSNVILPNESQTKQFLEWLSNFVSEKAFVDFDAFGAKVKRVDYAKDVSLGNHQVRLALDNLARFSLSRFRRRTEGETTVYFLSKTKNQHGRSPKTIRIYDKHQEVLDRACYSPDEFEAAKGIIRFEYSFLKPYTISNLANRLKLPNIYAETMFTDATAQAVMQVDEMKLCLGVLESLGETNLQKLRRLYPLKEAINLSGLISSVSEIGSEVYRHQEGISYNTFKYKARKCRKAGVSLSTT